MGNAARMISRAFARTVLMRYDEDARDARDVTFAYGARGKPSVRGPATLAARCGFSVSHCDGLTAVAVTTNGDACGIDVEDENRRIGTDVGKFARRWLSDDETRRLSDIVADDERARAFMRLWTAKESYVKALGLGIAGRPFREFDIAWDVAEDAAKTWSMDLRDVDRRWYRPLAVRAVETARIAVARHVAVRARGRRMVECLACACVGRRRSSRSSTSTRPMPTSSRSAAVEPRFDDDRSSSRQSDRHRNQCCNL